MPQKGTRRESSYRQKEERPNPELPANAEENRLYKQFNSRLPQPLIDRLGEVWKQTEFESRNAWLEHVLTEAADKIEQSLDADN